MLFVSIAEQGIDFNLAQVTHVHEVATTTTNLEVYLVGGQSFTLEGFNLKKWEHLKASVFRQMQLQQNTAGGVLGR